MARRPVPKKLAKKLAQIRANLGLGLEQEIVKALNYRASPTVSGAESHSSRAAGGVPQLMLLLAYAKLAGFSTDVLIDDSRRL